ncbi:hypothetical protein D9611_008046 [Ephemerocybe angulata]|uniref:F-box domain-containing protein n=1 Tax=Ephemerocybe angulata TaxID=980116 RepID=A0A8H5BZI0_9AGAR|nr:hypothetical protein D9611_008046 [Tulosesus angulatus]
MVRTRSAAKRFASKLSQELVDHIVDLLEDDSKSLKNLGLVSRSWSYRTRKHLFSTVTLRSREECLQLQMFTKHKPVLAHYITSLVLVSQGNVFGLGNIPWFGFCPIIIEMMSTMDSIEEVSIQGEEYRRLSWDYLSSAFQLAFYDLVAQPQVRCLELKHQFEVNVLPFVQCHNLKSLLLTNVRVSPTYSMDTGACFPLNAPSSPTNDSDEEGRLEYLSFTDCDEAIRTMLKCSRSAEGTLDIARPMELEVSTLGYDKYTTAVRNACSSQVTTYNVTHSPEEIEFPFIKAFPSKIFDLSRLPLLQNLNVDIHSPKPTALTALLDGLERLSVLRKDSPSDLDTVVLTFDLYPPSNDLDDNSNWDDIDITDDLNRLAYYYSIWERMEKIMMRGAFANLEKLELVFQFCFSMLDDPSTWDNAKAVMLRRMPRLNSKGVLKIRHE